MLIRFKVTNYLSFNTTQEFTTYRGRPQLKKDHLLQSGTKQLLKFSAIYGANASGKSNLIAAVSQSRQIILSGLPGGMAESYFKINPENKTKPTTFEYEIEINDKYYAYGFDLLLAESKIIGEWLYEITAGNQDKLIYQRQPLAGDTETEKAFELGRKYTNADLKAYLRGMKTNTQKLFLRDINDGKDDLFRENPKLRPIQDVFRWFAEKLIITPPGVLITPPDSRIGIRPFYLREDFDEDILNTIIPSLGLGVTSIKFQEEDPQNIRKYIPETEIAPLLQIISQQTKIFSTANHPVKEVTVAAQGNKEFLILKVNPETLKIESMKRMLFMHDGSPDIPFYYGEESDGTRILLNLTELLISAYSNSDNVYIIDEIDLGLHPLLSHRLIELFLTLSKGKMQLIVTTHELHLMDLDLLRRDEIWLITKHSNGESELKSLDEYSVRFDKRLIKAYLSGAYGAIPIIDTYLPLENDTKLTNEIKPETETQLAVAENTDANKYHKD